MKERVLRRFIGAIAVVATAASCVPPGAQPDPRGAIGVTAEPSAATRGEPFVTTDGWTVRIERLVLFAMLTAVEANATEGEPAEGLFLWNAGERTELILRAVRAGPRVVQAQLQGEVHFSVEGSPPSFYTNMDVDPALEDRFRLPPDGLEAADVGRFPKQPGVLLAVRAEKGDRSIRLDVSLVGRDAKLRQPIEVRADTITFVELEVLAERLFILDPETESTGIQEIADADHDGDGVVTGAELRETIVVRSDEEVDLLESLTRRTADLLVPR